MAKSDKKGNNRFTNAASAEDLVNQVNNNDLLLKIMKEEFPDDLFYAAGTLGHESPVKQSRKSFKGFNSNKSLKDATRNPNNVLDVTAQRDEYARYQLAKAFPTIDEEELDDLLDEEWDYFEDPDDPESEPIVIVQEPKPTGLFLVNSEADLRDYHDLYINDGPHTIEEDDPNVTDRIFCVFYVNNGIAYAIPTYKTLEVMLVERGLTYDAISEATPEQIKDFDLLLDGEVDEDNIDYGNESLDEDGDGEVTPIEEFRTRSYPVRDSDWNYPIRYRSGYRPKSPFLRDPGDYIKPESARSVDGRQGVDADGEPIIDVWQKEDPEDRYFDQVFQKQTYRERLREQYEGKMIVGDWPTPEYDGSEITMDTEIASDDAVLNVRMMINGHWKFTRDGAVMKLYAYLNDYDISGYSPGDAGRYGPTGYIQLLIEAGGCTVVTPAGGKDRQNDALAGDSDMSLSRDAEPLWNAFPHIVDADDDGEKGVDRAEYQEYLDNFNNGGAPFDIEHLRPYEPPGSIKYYPQKQYQDLVAQAIAQEQIDAIKEQIYEIWPGVASLIQNTKIQFDALPADYGKYVTRLLGDGSPLYKLMIARKGKWKYIKKKTLGKDRIKTKTSSNKLFKVCNRKLGIKMSLNEGQEERLVKNYKWMKTVQRDKFAAWMSGGAAAGIASAPVAAGAGVFISGQISVAAAAAGVAAFEASLIAAGTSLLPAVTVTATAPALGATLGALATNPITIGAAAIVGAFFLADKIIGEVPNDEYDLPPWRFMDDNWYLKACIYNEIDDYVEGFKQAADAADTMMPWVAGMIDQMYDGMGDVDEALLNAMQVEEFEGIYEYLLAIQKLCDELNDSGLYAQGVDLQSEIDAYLKKQLKNQYNAIQYLRKRVYNKGLLFKKRQKYGIVWPKGPQNILNTYVPGCKFDNYIPKV
tara:strand:- start:8270 stop:11032 length:2763 start_codon:yes stop_codon:yes gene_type:complete